MTIEQTNYYEEIKKKGNKYVYYKEEEAEMDREDYLNLMQRQQLQIDEFRQQKKIINKEIKSKEEFLEKNKAIYAQAVKDAELQFCTKCGKNLGLEPKKRYKNQALCTNCAADNTVV